MQEKQRPGKDFSHLSRLISSALEALAFAQVFSNSLKIHQVETKQITTEKEVWIPDLN